MLESIKSILAILKIKNHHIFLIALLSAFLIFSPEKWLKEIYVFDFSQNYRLYIALIFLTSTGLFLINSIILIYPIIKNYYNEIQRKNCIINYLKNLTEGEKEILRYYHHYQTKSNRLKLDDGTVALLREKGIIYIATERGSIISGSDHNISEIAWNYIETHPDILNGKSNYCRTDKKYYE